jgi:hypothetical protein
LLLFLLLLLDVDFSILLFLVELIVFIFLFFNDSISEVRDSRKSWLVLRINRLLFGANKCPERLPSSSQELIFFNYGQCSSMPNMLQEARNVKPIYSLNSDELWDGECVPEAGDLSDCCKLCKSDHPEFLEPILQRRSNSRDVYEVLRAEFFCGFNTPVPLREKQDIKPTFPPNSLS